MNQAARSMVLAMLLVSAPVAAAKKPPKTAAAPAPAAVQPSVRAGVELWRTGDYAGAVAMWQPFAQAGDKDALFNIGQAYKLGRALPKDPVLARDYYRRAAMQGHLPAQANLGILLFQAGEKPEAIKWLKAAADKNEMRAQYVLGVATWNGDGVPRSLTLAYAYLARASALGLPEATTALNTLTQSISPLERANGWAVATSLQNGNGVPPEFAGGQRSTTVAAIDPANRDQVIKPLPKPVVPVPAPVAAKPVAVLPPVAVAAAPPVAAEPPPAMIARTPAPVPVVAKPVPEVQKPEPVVVAKAQPAPAPKPVVIDKPVEVAAVQVPVVKAAPKPEPVKVAAVTPKPEPKAVAKPAVKKPDGWRVQLGAFTKKAQAEAAWTEVKSKQKQLVGKKEPIYLTDGGVTKLQLGPFAKKDDARDACAKIAFSGRACFVTNG